MRRLVRFRWTITIALLLIVVLVVALAARERSSQQPSTSGQVMTLDPRIIANLTEIPQATPLAGQDANALVGLQQMVEACPDYTTERRQQMIEQIGFIVNPAQLTRNIIIALGANPRGRLLFAIGQVTKIQWQLLNRVPESCLVPIGKRINELLVAAGETPEPAFEGGGS